MPPKRKKGATASSLFRPPGTYTGRRPRQEGTYTGGLPVPLPPSRLMPELTPEGTYANPAAATLVPQLTPQGTYAYPAAATQPATAAPQPTTAEPRRWQPWQTAEPVQPYETYLPTVGRYQPAWWYDWLRQRGSLGQPAYNVATAPAATPTPTPAPTTTGTRAATTPTTPEGPPGVAKWYGEFTKEHGGKTPEEFYKSEQYGLAQALADREWGQGFQQMYGRAPSQDDWQAWYYEKTGSKWRAMSPSEREHAKKEARHKGRMKWAKGKGWDHWNTYERAVQEGWAEPGMSYEEAMANKEQQAGEAERAPLYVPPQIYWR